MIDKPKLFVFGEVLFDCFPSGEQVLGGAPFNVAWHLQALGNQPHFISRVGTDELGRKILNAMADWGMDSTTVQRDPLHLTGQVEVKVIDNEPHYAITPDCAYDFIAPSDVNELPSKGILYHGTLGLRNPVSRSAFNQLARQPEMSIFLDVNLRYPWWQKEEVYAWLEQARWVKLNQDELRLLGFTSNDTLQAVAELQSRFHPELVILTQGEEGALVRSRDGAMFQIVPEPIKHFVDTVGAGDAFSAIFLHGLVASWPIADILTVAQQFAGKVIGLRGAIPEEPDFYQYFIN